MPKKRPPRAGIIGAAATAKTELAKVLTPGEENAARECSSS